MNDADHDQQEPRADRRFFGLNATQLSLGALGVLAVIGLAANLYFVVLDGGGDGDDEAVDRATPTAEAPSDESPTAEAPTSEPTPDGSPAAEGPEAEAAQAALLTLEDMPAGWTSLPNVERESQPELSADCALLNEKLAPGGTPTRQSDNFVGPEDQEASSSASAFASEGDATAAMDSYVATMSSCLEELGSAFEKYYDTTLTVEVGQPVVSELAFEELAHEQMADGSAAYRMSGGFTAAESRLAIVTDYYFFRSGRLVGGLTFAVYGDASPAEEAAVAARAAEKLEAAGATLED